MTPYDRLMKTTAALAKTAYANDMSPQDVAIRIDYDYWFTELLPSTMQSTLYIFHPEERQDSFRMNGVLVIRDNRDPKKSLFNG